MEKIFLETLSGKQCGRAPFWYMRQAGRYLPEYRALRASCNGFLDLCYNPQKAAEVTLQPLRRFGMDAAILFSDILVVAHALGADLAFVEGEGPKLGAIRDETGFNTLSLNRVEEHVQPVLETVKRVKADLPPGVALIGFAGAPWTVACYMVEGGGSREFERTRSLALSQPQFFARLVGLIEQATVIYLRGQIESGAEVIQLFDSWGGILPESEFSRWVIEPTARIVGALGRDYPHIPMIGFPRLAGTKALAYARATGVNAIGIDHTASMRHFADGAARTETRCVPQGNLDPFALASDKQVALEQAKKLIDELKDMPFIFNLGHGMQPGTPVENVQALSDFLRG